MKVALKLYATLSDYLPVEAHKTNRLDLDVEPGTTPADLIQRFSLPNQLCHLVLIDGVFIPSATRAERVLQDGEVLAIWPPVAGG